MVSAEANAVLPDRIEAVAARPGPTSVREERECLGLVGYCRRHVSGFAGIARPMTDILKCDRHAEKSSSGQKKRRSPLRG